LIIIKRKPPGVNAGDAYWKMEAARDFQGAIYSRKKNHKGDDIPAWDLIPDPEGGIHAYYLHYAMNTAVPTTLGTAPNDPDLFITANLNGCSFSYAQARGAGAYVAHHNDQQGGNDPATMEGQVIPANNPEYLHQADYRKERDGAIDTSYEATLVGERKGQVWHFYCQRRKGSVENIAGSRSTLWRLKDVRSLSP
jgi:hypothetical protein